MADKLVANQTTTDPTSPTARDLVSKFLDKNNIELRLTPLAQVMQDGGVIITPQQIVAQFKSANVPDSIAQN